MVSLERMVVREIEGEKNKVLSLINMVLALIILVANIILIIPLTYDVIDTGGGPEGFGLMILPYTFTIHLLLIASLTTFISKKYDKFTKTILSLIILTILLFSFASFFYGSVFVSLFVVFLIVILLLTLIKRIAIPQLLIGINIFSILLLILLMIY